MRLLLIALLAFIVVARAIPESEVDYSDPDLLGKIIRRELVIDPPEEHRRSIVGGIAALWTSENNVGDPKYTLNIYNTSIDIIPPSDGISSVWLYNLNYILVLYKSFYLQSEVRTFRTTKPIQKLADQGDFNDDTRSAAIYYIGPQLYGVNLWEGPNFSRRVEYATNIPGLYTQMSGSGCNGCLSIGSDTLSSFEVMPNVQLYIYQHTNYGGTAAGPFPAALQQSIFEIPRMNSSSTILGENQVSSFKVYFY